METSLRGLPNCPRCGGKGVILPDWNIRAVAIVCNCTSGVMPEPKFTVDIEDYLKDCSMDRFLKYWMNVELANRSTERVEKELANLERSCSLLEGEELNHTHGFLSQCQNKMGGWQMDLLLAPYCFNNGVLWSKGRLDYHLFLVLGEEQKGKTYLLASLLMDRCKSKSVNGKFLRCRALSQYIKNATWGGPKSNQRYSETIEEILKVDVLALDDLDKIDKDERVAKVFMMIISERLSTGKPTLISYDIDEFAIIDKESQISLANDKSILKYIMESQRIKLLPYFDVKVNQAFEHKVKALQDEQK